MKTCTGCGETKSLSEYNKNAKSKDGHATRCRECRKKQNREHYHNGYNSRRKDIDAENRKAKREWLEQYKRDLKCEECGENRWYILDFHHKDPSEKEGAIGRLVERYSKKRLLKEIAKCIVLCRNCHGELHYLERTMEECQSGNGSDC